MPSAADDEPRERADPPSDRRGSSEEIPAEEPTATTCAANQTAPGPREEVDGAEREREGEEACSICVRGIDLSRKRSSARNRSAGPMPAMNTMKSASLKRNALPAVETNGYISTAGNTGNELKYRSLALPVCGSMTGFPAASSWRTIAQSLPMSSSRRRCRPTMSSSVRYQRPAFQTSAWTAKWLFIVWIEPSARPSTRRPWCTPPRFRTRSRACA